MIQIAQPLDGPASGPSSVGDTGGSASAVAAGSPSTSDPAGKPPPGARGEAVRAAAADLERLGEEIAELSAHIDAATYRMLALIGRFDRAFQMAGGGMGFTSTAHWLSWRTGLGPGAAREHVRVARGLEELPLISERMQRGELSYSKVRALTRVARPDTEADLLEFALRGTAAHVERLVRAWRKVDRQEAAAVGGGEAELRRREARHLSLYPEEDGTWKLRARLEPEVGALLRQALQAAHDTLFREGRRAGDDGGGGGEAPTTQASGGVRRTEAGLRETTVEQRRADALELLVEWAMDAGTAGAGDSAAGNAEAEAGDGEVSVAGGGADAGGDVQVRDDHGAASAAGSTRRPRPAPISASRAARFRVVVHSTRAHLARTGACGCEHGVPAGTPALPGLPEMAAGLPGVPGLPAGAPLPGAPGAVLADGGIRLGVETARRLSCDACRVEVRRGTDGSVLDVGRQRRTVPEPLRRALEVRDGGCRFPGCGRRLCDAHHVVHWASGGETSIENLVLLCRRHHRSIHEDGFRVEVEGAAVRFRRPDGRPLPQAPARPQPPGVEWGAAADALAAANRELGLEIGPESSMSLWHGEPLDRPLAIDLMWRPPPGEGHGR